jgi:hypothetical protein
MRIKKASLRLNLAIETVMLEHRFASSCGLLRCRSVDLLRGNDERAQ